VITTTKDYMNKEPQLLTAYMKVLVEGAHQFYADFDAAIDDLQPIYGVPRPILAVALRRQAPNPVIRDAGAYGIRNAVKYLIDLGYLKTNVANEVLALHLQA
jgi:NitT/TauT family transport system substrate-binding protein